MFAVSPHIALECVLNLRLDLCRPRLGLELNEIAASLDALDAAHGGLPPELPFDLAFKETQPLFTMTLMYCEVIGSWLLIAATASRAMSGSGLSPTLGTRTSRSFATPATPTTRLATLSASYLSI